MAVKVFRLDITPEQSAALVRALEALIASRLAHRHVAAPIAAGTDVHSPYLALEYVVGDSLDVATRKSEHGPAGSMPLAEVAPIVEGIAAAIDFCAARGVHHGLLHPRDVIMSADGPRVTGFGVADALAGIGLRLPVRRPYAAPEGSSDVYSLAAIAYELLSGRGMTPSGWDELSAVNGPELRDAFAAALSPDPQARPRRAAEFAEKLTAAAGAASVRSDASRRSITSAVPAEELATMAPEPVTIVPDPDPEFDSRGLDRFADAGTAADLHLDFVEPPFSPSAEVEPMHSPGIFNTEPAPPRFRGSTLVILGLLAFAVAGVASYVVKARRPAPPAAAAKPAPKPPVSSTTVDLPPAPTPDRSNPPTAQPNLPPPAPSRPASGAPSMPPPAVGRGRLLIRSTPSDAMVTVNGEPRGKSPLTLRELPLGSYTIHLTRAGFAAADRRVRLTARQPSGSIEVALKPLAAAPSAETSGAGSLFAESRPVGARIFVNDRLMGTTPLAVPDLPAGPVTVRMEMDGYQSWVTSVRVKPGERTRVAASLDRK